MKKFLISLLLSFGSMTLVAGGDNNALIAAAQTGDLAALKVIFSDDNLSLGAMVDAAFLAAYYAQQPKDVQLFLLSKSTTKGSLWTNACTRGPVELVKILIEDDAKTDGRNTLANHCHILNAKDSGQIAIAQMVQAHLIAKGYDYAGTIQLNQ
jgi:hypothetical protein